jgi:hypothetical protein
MKKKFFAHLRKWHRRLGISAAVFILLLSFSGIALNHSDQLGLPHSNVDSRFVTTLYGLKDPDSIRAFAIADNFLIAADGQLWLGDHYIMDNVGELKSAVVFSGVIVAIVDQQLLLISKDGEVIEKMDSAAGIPEKISQLAASINPKDSADRIWIKTETEWFESDKELLQWQRTETPETPVLSTPFQLSSEQKQRFSNNFRSRLITWERVVLDFHSGRILGIAGPLFSDLVALLLILLSVSGISMWVRNSRKPKIIRKTKK